MPEEIKNKYENIWQAIFLHLTEDGFDVYPPATKTGDCKNNYIVLRNAGGSQIGSLSSTDSFYDLMCYVPKDKYSTLETFFQSVKKSMAKMKPMIYPTGVETGSYYDEQYKAFMVSIEYKNHKKQF